MAMTDEFEYFLKHGDGLENWKIVRILIFFTNILKCYLKLVCSKKNYLTYEYFLQYVQTKFFMELPCPTIQYYMLLVCRPSATDQHKTPYLSNCYKV